MWAASSEGARPASPFDHGPAALLLERPRPIHRAGVRDDGNGVADREFLGDPAGGRRVEGRKDDDSRRRRRGRGRVPVLHEDPAAKGGDRPGGPKRRLSHRLPVGREEDNVRPARRVFASERRERIIRSSRLPDPEDRLHGKEPAYGAAKPERQRVAPPVVEAAKN
jgi:hypothetical protein